MQKNKHDRNLQPAINKSRTETLKNPGQSCFYSPVLLAMLMKILLPCRHSAPDMPLRFIGVKHLACLLGKGGINLEEPFGDVWWCQGKNKKTTSSSPFSKKSHLSKAILYISSLYSSILLFVFSISAINASYSGYFI